MNIVHVIPAFTKGGAERVAVDLANAAVANGDAVAIVAAFHVPEDLLLCDLRDEVDVRYVARSAGSILAAYLRLLPWMLRNREWLLSRDIIHCHLTFGSLFGAVATAMRALRRGNRPRIVETYHGIGAPVRLPLKRFHMALAATHDGFIAMAEDEPWSRFARDHPKVRSAMIPNGIALDLAPPTKAASDAYRAEAGIPSNALVIGSVGRLVRERRPEMLMRIFERVARSIPDAHLLMAGSGPEAKRLGIMAAEAGLAERVHLPGLALRPALPLSIIHLYLTLNVGPITGIAALEAAAMGLPLIAFQANDAYRTGPGDWIYSSSDPSAVAAEAVRLLGSVEARRALAARQHQHVLAHHGAEAMFRAYRAFYEKILGSPD
ncbi:glycosyltransferase [Sphingomonas sp.]|uniref:glycosyltransferase n=1 Tax=Sphingomonas sp. TaxID=28214 RepID=UPI00286ABAA7|nr:glycosyltransferase [Sphingomonas sp.]